MNTKMEILLGDNPFFGIDHLSQDRARKRMEILNGFQKTVEVIEHALELGVTGFVVSTHPQLKELINYMENKTKLLDSLRFFPILPYAQGYVSKVTEKGIAGAINDILSRGTLQEKLRIFFNGSIGYLQKDFEKLLQTFIDVELLPLARVKKDTIFLHDVITDLAISLNMKNIIQIFIDHVENNYGIHGGLVTKNFPLLISQLKKWDIEFPTIMTSFNTIGNQMNPSKNECEKCLLENDVKVIAMNVLAGGLLKPHDCVDYISKLKLNSIVVGMSTKEHVNETVTIFRNHNDG